MLTTMELLPTHPLPPAIYGKVDYWYQLVVFRVMVTIVGAFKRILQFPHTPHLAYPPQLQLSRVRLSSSP